MPQALLVVRKAVVEQLVLHEAHLIIARLPPIPAGAEGEDRCHCAAGRPGLERWRISANAACCGSCNLGPGPTACCHGQRKPHGIPDHHPGLRAPPDGCHHGQAARAGIRPRRHRQGDGEGDRGRRGRQGQEEEADPSPRTRTRARASACRLTRAWSSPAPAPASTRASRCARSPTARGSSACSRSTRPTSPRSRCCAAARCAAPSSITCAAGAASRRASSSARTRAPSASTPPSRASSGPKGEADDLTRIKGVTAELAGQLNGLGVIRFDQIANFSDDDIANVDETLSLDGRIEKDDWVRPGAGPGRRAGRRRGARRRQGRQERRQEGLTPRLRRA